MDGNIAFLGTGRMAGAIIQGLIANKLFDPSQIKGLGGKGNTARKLAEDSGITDVDNLKELLKGASTLVLACKPQHFSELSDSLVSQTRGRLVISILAGIPLRLLAKKFPEAVAVVRSMPNTPGQIGLGATVYCANHPLQEPVKKQVESILGSLGMVLPVLEDQVDLITALSGSGPAYIFEMGAGLVEAASQLGLPRPIADQLVRQTFLGASTLLHQKTQVQPEDLRNEVTSPGGTTEAGLSIFQKKGFRETLLQVLTAARNRSIELAHY